MEAYTKLCSVIVFLMLSLGSFAFAEGMTVTKNSSTTKISGSAMVDSTTIRSAQQALRREGHSISVDGVMGPNTTKAIREFQSENDLSQTGQLDSATLSALEVETSGREPASVPSETMDRGINNDNQPDTDTSW